jgi:hypothetical protein
MTRIRTKLAHLERRLGNGPCVACAGMPRVFLIASPQDRAAFEQRMRDRAKRCTCGRPFNVKTITMES